MSPRRFTRRKASLQGTPVLITGHARRGETEAVVLRVRHLSDSVEARLLLSDGTPASARLDLADWEWLEVRTGDIVGVQRHHRVALSA